MEQRFSMQEQMDSFHMAKSRIIDNLCKQVKIHKTLFPGHAIARAAFAGQIAIIGRLNLQCQGYLGLSCQIAPEPGEKQGDFLGEENLYILWGFQEFRLFNPELK
jgi:hypothetical protein